MEGFFGKGTKNGGMENLGHAYSAFVISDFFTHRIRAAGWDPRQAAVTGAILSLGVQTLVEVFDGFSDSHGFSHEDMVMNLAGVTFS